MKVQLEAVTVRFGERLALDAVDLSVSAGELVALIGPPESGKSVLLKVAAGLVLPTSGRVRAGADVVVPAADDVLDRWRQRVGMAFQNDALFDALSVADNVGFPLRRRGVDETMVEERVRVMLERVGLAQARDRLPTAISGGMRKRCGIARAAVTGPELALFDDPVAGLDPLTSQRIVALVRELAMEGGAAALVVTNDLPAVLPSAHRVVMLLEGRVVYDGTPAQLFGAAHPAVRQFVTGADDGPL